MASQIKRKIWNKIENKNFKKLIKEIPPHA